MYISYGDGFSFFDMKYSCFLYVQYGDTMTNIVVVQFSEDIQTSMDMKYNLTCTTRAPGSAIVTSGYIGAG
jgi:hypothetical protein